LKHTNNLKEFIYLFLYSSKLFTKSCITTFFAQKQWVYTSKCYCTNTDILGNINRHKKDLEMKMYKRRLLHTYWNHKQRRQIMIIFILWEKWSHT